MDPLAEKYAAWSPYNYTLNNPVNNTDSSGMCPDDDPNCFDSQVVIERKGYSQFRRFLFKAQAFIHGTFNAWQDNNLPTDASNRYAGVYSNELQADPYNWGISVGNALSVVQGIQETATGISAIGTSVAAEVGSVGTATPVVVVTTTAGAALVAHGSNTALQGLKKLLGGDRVYATEPKLPDKTIVKDGQVEIKHYTRSGDHAPPHAHVVGGGKEVRIGQNGKPLRGDPELSTTQQTVIIENKSTIRKAIRQIGRWHKHQNE